MTQPTNRGFFFVHRHDSSENPSQNSDKEKFQILSHVRKPTVVRKPWMQYSNVLDVTGDTYCQKNKQTHKEEVTSHYSLSRGRSYDDHDTYLQTTVPWLLTLDHNESVYSFLSSMRPSFNDSDPFHYTASSSSAADGPHLIGNSIENHVLPNNFYTESLKPSLDIETPESSMHRQARLERLEARTGDEMLLYSSIAHDSSSSAWKHGQISDSRSQFWVGQTLKTLRSQLARPDRSNDDSVVLSVFTLALVALWNGLPRMWSDDLPEIDASQFSVAQTHLRAMLVLIERAGGWHRFSPHILEGMLLVDKYTALYTLSPPLIPLTFDASAEPLDFSSSRVPAQSAMPEMATGFQKLDIDLELKQILLDVGTFYHAAAGIWQVKVQLTSRQQNVLYRRFQALHYRLLLLNTTSTASELVRQTTLVILCNTTLYAAGLVFTRVMLRHLYAAMTAIDSRANKVDSEIWRWCLCTGATTRLATNEKSWFVDQFLGCCTEMGPESIFSIVPRLMIKYIYIPWLQNKELRALIDRKRAARTAKENVQRP